METETIKCGCEDCSCKGDQPNKEILEEKTPIPVTFLPVGISVYPNTGTPIVVVDDEYGGAHLYLAPMSLGMIDGQNAFTDQAHAVRFVHKYNDAFGRPVTEAGLTDSELVVILLDRLAKLNNKFPSAQYDKMKQGLEMYLEGNRERIDDRLSRNVSGQLKN